LICKFCAQWNPDATKRCCFCDNVFDGTEDQTSHGTPSYVRNTGRQFQVPKAQRSIFDKVPSFDEGFDINLSAMWRKGGIERALVIAAVVVVAVIVVGMTLRC